MNFHVLTLFPEMIEQGLHTSIIGRAIEKEKITLNVVNIRDYTKDKHGSVDDYTYGGGAGMLMQAQPVYDSYCFVKQKIQQSRKISKKIHTIYVTPQGRSFTQTIAAELAEEEDLIFLCGHYEGIDERVLEEIVTDSISIGDYILTGGELPTMVMIDAISRLVPGVLNNNNSSEIESFHNDLLEYPQYTRPEIWHNKKVPEVLLSGNHSKIAKWRLKQAEERTAHIRPELYQKYTKKQEVIERLSKRKRSNIHIIESLARGSGEILYEKYNEKNPFIGQNLLVYDKKSKTYMLTAENIEEGINLISFLPKDAALFVVSQEFLKNLLIEKLGAEYYCQCYQACYTKKEPLPIPYKEIYLLEESHLDYLLEHYHSEKEYLQARIREKAIYGAFWNNRLVGFVGTHKEGSMGMLFVEEEFRRKKIGKSLEAFCINYHLAKGNIPFCQIYTDNQASLHLQEKLGLYLSEDTIWWLGKEDS